MLGTSAIGDTVSSLTSPDSTCTTDGRDRVRRRQGERHIDACMRGTDGNVGPSVIVWAGFHYGGKMGAGCAGPHHEPASVQTCAATKSLTLGKSRLPEQL